MELTSCGLLPGCGCDGCCIKCNIRHEGGGLNAGPTSMELHKNLLNVLTGGLVSTFIAVNDLVDRYREAVRSRDHHPVLLAGLFVLARASVRDRGRRPGELRGGG